MSEKRRKINKFANYQKYINSEKQSRLRPQCFYSFSKSLIFGFWRNAHDQYTNLLARPLMAALQVVKTSFGFHLRECKGSSFSSIPWGSYFRTTSRENSLLITNTGMQS